MPKIHYMSDLHLEFAGFDASKLHGENLILAGDITLLSCLDPKRTDARNRKLRAKTLDFFNTVCANFDRVFYLTGNHESYHFDISLEKDTIREYLPNVIHLDNTRYDLDENTVLLGGTLWTNMNNGNPLDMLAIQKGMNDFTYIKNQKLPFTPEDARLKHAETLYFLANELANLDDKKVIIATHHSPSSIGLSGKHHGNNLNSGYYSDLENFIFMHPQIKAWIFGHTHIRLDFMLGDCRLLSNARGYYGHEATSKTFDPDTWSEL